LDVPTGAGSDPAIGAYGGSVVGGTAAAANGVSGDADQPAGDTSDAERPAAPAQPGGSLTSYGSSGGGGLTLVLPLPWVALLGAVMVGVGTFLPRLAEEAWA
jgi:hypothetical protein